MGNILGEAFEPYVLDEIERRQKIYGSGYLPSTQRSPQELNYLNNRNAWVKFASAVEITPTPEGIDRLNQIGIENTDNFLGKKLAQQAILFNSFSSQELNNEEKFNNYNFRSGISTNNSLWNNSAYGLGGVNYGLQPPPGIISVNVEALNRGSIKRATVEILAHNKFQFEILEILYLRLGYTVMLEWGWDKYIDKNGVLTNVQNTLIEDFWFTPDVYTVLEILKKIEKYRKTYNANYDGFLGKVTNFDWKFNPNGTYSITLSLITVGDVIESLKANTSSNKGIIVDTKNLPEVYKGLEESPILKGAPNSELGGWLYTLISYGDEVWGNNSDYYKDYFLLPNSYKAALFSNEIIKVDIKNRYKYYLTLGKLLQKIATDIIPTIKTESSSEPMIQVDYAEDDNFISAYNQQISLDPRVCLIKPQPPLSNYSTVFKDLKDFFIEGTGDNRTGYLTNIYLNLDFIASTLISNTDSEGNISIYRFIESICNGINKALGNVCNLEPVLKNDKILTIIDQNPIKTRFNKPERLFEVYGYNPDGSSNFIRDISFNTKITPKLADQITIGATADGRSSRSIEGTSFQKWNIGLKDRFSQQIEEKTDTTSEERKRIIEETLGEIWDNETFQDTTNPITGGRTKTITTTKVDGIKRTYLNVTRKSFIAQSFIEKETYLRKTENSQLALSSYRTNWTTYKSTAFAGSEKSNLGAFYPLMDPKQISIGKEVFKNYLINSTNSNFVINKNTSAQSGFIPIELSLKFEGISGIKLYQALEVNNKILPYNYPKAFNFLITKVNHTISNNDWVTNLSTLSTANINSNNEEDEVINTTEDRISDKERFDTQSLRISNNGLELIKKHEDFREKAYDDFNADADAELTANTPIRGTLTIGYGFTKAVIPNLKWDTIITQSEADALLRDKIKIYENTVKDSIKAPLTQNEFDALVSIAYNAGEIGNTSAGEPTPLKDALNQEQYGEAANIIPKYRITSKRKIITGLISRRKAEQNLFLT